MNRAPEAPRTGLRWDRKWRLQEPHTHPSMTLLRLQSLGISLFCLWSVLYGLCLFPSPVTLNIPQFLSCVLRLRITYIPLCFSSAHIVLSLVTLSDRMSSTFLCPLPTVSQSFSNSYFSCSCPPRHHPLCSPRCFCPLPSPSPTSARPPYIIRYGERRTTVTAVSFKPSF